MQRGTKPNPLNVIELRNNAGKLPLLKEEPQIEPILDLPPAPKTLKREARKEWDRCIPFLVRNKIMGPEALTLLSTYCFLAGKEVEAEKRDELLPCSYITALRQLAEIFGFTPSGRARLRTGNGKKETDEAERFFG